MEVRMMERPDEPASEALSTIGLFLNIAAVLAFATGLAGLGTSTSILAPAILAVAVVAFAASLICFAVGGRRIDHRCTQHVTSVR